MDSVMYMDGDTRREVCGTVSCTWMVIHGGKCVDSDGVYMDGDTRRVVCGQCHVHGW